MEKAFSKTDWNDDFAPFITADELDRIENGIDTIDDRVVSMDVKVTEAYDNSASALSGISVIQGTYAQKTELPDIATTEKAGIVKPDGSTTYIDEDGTLHAVGGSGGGGTGGTSNYNDLSNKPSINGVSLQGNKTLEDLGVDKMAEEKVTGLHEDTLGGFTPVIDQSTGQITGYTTKIGGADTVFPFSKKMTGTFVTSTSASVKVTLGFKPKSLFIKGSTHENIYSEDINRTVRITVSGRTAEVISLSNTSNNRLNSIDSDGFTYGKSNVGVETMTYYAYG